MLSGCQRSTYLDWGRFAWFVNAKQWLSKQSLECFRNLSLNSCFGFGTLIPRRHRNCENVRSRLFHFSWNIWVRLLAEGRRGKDTDTPVLLPPSWKQCVHHFVFFLNIPFESYYLSKFAGVRESSWTATLWPELHPDLHLSNKPCLNSM